MEAKEAEGKQTLTPSRFLERVSATITSSTMEAASSSWSRASGSPTIREERRSGDRDLLAMSDRRPVESYGDRRRHENSDKHDRANDQLTVPRGKGRGIGSMRSRFNKTNESDQGWSHGGRGGDYSPKNFSQTNEGDRGWSGKNGKERSTEMGRSSHDRSSNAESVERHRKSSDGRNWGGQKAEESARNGGISASSSGRQWGKYKDERWKNEDKKEDNMHKNGTLSDRMSKRGRASAREEREDSGFEDDSDARERRIQRLKRRRRSAGLNSSEDDRSPDRTREGRWQSPPSVSATTPDRAARGRDSKWRNSSRAEETRGEEAFKERKERYGRRMKEESRSSAARDSSRRNEDDRWRHASRSRRRHDNSQEPESQRRDMVAITADRREDGNRSSDQHPESRKDRHEHREDETHRYRQSHRSNADSESPSRRSRDVEEDDVQQWSESNVRRRDGDDGRRGSQKRGYRPERIRFSGKPISTGRYSNARHDRSDEERDERHKYRGSQANNASQSTGRNQRSMNYQDEKGRGLQRDTYRDRRRSRSPSARQIPSPHIDHNEERSWPPRDRRNPDHDRRVFGRYSGAHQGDTSSGLDRYNHERAPRSDQRLAETEETLRIQGRKEEDIAPSSAMQAAMEAALGVPSEILRPERDIMDDRGSLSLEAHSPTFLPVLRARPDEVYEQVAQVGEGTYGQVFKARGDRSGVIVALKKIRMESEKDGFPITAMREIKLLQSLRHDNIVRLHEMLLSKNSVYMVFEYLQHDLNGILAQSSVRFGPAHLKSLAQQLLSGLAYLHHHSILHRDLKGSNLLLNSEGTLKLADFGLARRYNKRAQGNVDYTNRVVTLWYRPPELLFGETCYNDAIDIWGAGCIFLELFTRKPVFQGNDEIHQVQVLLEVLGPINTYNWPSVETLPWYDLVRPSSSNEGNRDQEANGVSYSNLRTLFAEQVPPDALDVASALLCYDPAQRLSAVDALHLDYFARNLPRPEKPRSILAKVSGDWHEFESRQARRTLTIMSRPTTQVDKGEASKEITQASSSTSNIAMGPPEVQPSTSSHKSALADNRGIYA